MSEIFRKALNFAGYSLVQTAGRVGSGDMRKDGGPLAGDGQWGGEERSHQILVYFH